MRENFGFPDLTISKFANLEKRKQEIEETEEEEKLPAQNNVLNMVKFEDCNFEDCTIILNFEAPD